MSRQAAVSFLLPASVLIHVLAYLWHVGRSTRSFYGLGTLRAAALAPLTVLFASLGYIMVAFGMNVVFILIG